MMLPFQYDLATYNSTNAKEWASTIDASDYLNGKQNYRNWRTTVFKVIGAGLAARFTSLEQGQFDVGRQPEDAGLYEFLTTVVSEDIRKAIMTPLGQFQGNPYTLWTALARWYS